MPIITLTIELGMNTKIFLKQHEMNKNNLLELSSRGVGEGKTSSSYYGRPQCTSEKQHNRSRKSNTLVDFCMTNNMIILNTLVEHRDIHKYTREEKGGK